jgi:hypothetical protein
MREEKIYNVMKEQAFRKAVKSTFVLVNGGKVVGGHYSNGNTA